MNIVCHPALRRPRGWVVVVLCAALAGGWLLTRPPRELKVEAYIWQRRDSSALRDALARSKPLLARCHFLGVEMARDASGWRVSRSSVPDDLFEGQGLVLRLGASLAGENWEKSETLARVMEEAGAFGAASLHYVYEQWRQYGRRPPEFLAEIAAQEAAGVVYGKDAGSSSAGAPRS